MLKRFLWLDLQLFGEGGEGGDGGVSSAPASTSSDSGAEGSTGGLSGVEESILGTIPESARKHYDKAVAKLKSSGNVSQVQSATVIPTADNNNNVTDNAPKKLTYADMIKSDEYKAEHEAYMQKTIGERLKRYKGVEEENSKFKELASLIGAKYGLDSNDKDFLENLTKSVKDDDATYEAYALEHDVSVNEAKRIMNLEQQIKVAEAKERVARENEERNRLWNQLKTNAEQTKSIYAGFDLDAEMQNPRFRSLLGVLNGDTTQAYRTLHYDELQQAQAQLVAEKMAQNAKSAQVMATQAVASGSQRPIEGAMSRAGATSIPAQNQFKGMSVAELQKIADDFRNGRRTV